MFSALILLIECPLSSVAPELTAIFNLALDEAFPESDYQRRFPGLKSA